MRQYVLDEIGRSDLDRIKTYLNDKAQASGLEGLWWVEVPRELLSLEQQEHRECQPHRFAVELGRTSLRFEFFIRSNRHLRCSCAGYAGLEQRAWIMNFADLLVEDLQLRT